MAERLAYFLERLAGGWKRRQQPGGLECVWSDRSRWKYLWHHHQFTDVLYFRGFKCQWNDCVGKSISDALDAIEICLCLLPEHSHCVADSDFGLEAVERRARVKQKFPTLLL